MAEKYEIVKVNAKDFVQTVGKMPFTTKQMNLIMSRTPERHIKERPIPGGGTAKFVAGQYMINMLNLLTGFRWSFDVLSENEKHKQIIVKGQLTAEFKDGTKIIKTQFGRSMVKYHKGSTDPVDYGNDFKAASTDALKKCASQMGIAWDVYSSDEYNEIQIVDKVVQERNKEIEQAEILATPIAEVQQRVEAKLDSMATQDRLRTLKKVRKMNTKNLTDGDWRFLDRELGTENDN